MNNNQDEFSTPIDARDKQVTQPEPQPSPQPEKNQVEPPEPLPQPDLTPLEAKVNNSKKNSDLPLVIFGLIVILILPVAIFYLSTQRERISSFYCTKQDSQDALITHEVNGIIDGNEIQNIEYFLSYDVTDIKSSDKPKVKEDLEKLGDKYKEYKTTYIVEENKNKMILRVYAKPEAIVKFFDGKYATNKNYFLDFVDTRDFICTEKG